MIPQVNAGATDRNREQTKRIIEILDDGTDPLFDYELFQESSCYGSAKIINGSFTLCQVAGMLEAEGVKWRTDLSGWVLYMRKTILHDAHPHNLTAAMDALIKVLETKGEKE